MLFILEWWEVLRFCILAVGFFFLQTDNFIEWFGV